MLWKNPRSSIELPAEAAAAYEAMVELAPLDHYVEKQGRSTGRYALRSSGGSETFFLKRYFRLPWWRRWLAPLGSFPGPQEMAHLRLAGELGIPVPEVLAAGAERAHRCQSFLAVRELVGFLPLHEFIPRRLAEAATDLPSHRRALTRRIATLARVLHGARLYHRDLYLCHFFIRPAADAPDGFELEMIDFLRLKRSRLARWRLKDLAQLLFSADIAGITRADRLRFFKHYLGTEKFSAADRRLLKQVERKANRYRRHNAKMEAGQTRRTKCE